jgi:hypothetical protein
MNEPVLPPNLARMLQLVNEVFDTRSDPGQISVDDEEAALLASIHPATLSELANDDGPYVWILLLPTTRPLMLQFLAGDITEKQLLFSTTPGDAYDTIYLCSALVLPEYRRSGLAMKVTLDAINSIRAQHAITSLCYWKFSDGGKKLAEAIATQLGLELFEKL